MHIRTYSISHANTYYRGSSESDRLTLTRHNNKTNNYMLGRNIIGSINSLDLFFYFFFLCKPFYIKGGIHFKRE